MASVRVLEFGVFVFVITGSPPPPSISPPPTPSLVKTLLSILISPFFYNITKETVCSKTLVLNLLLLRLQVGLLDIKLK